MCSQRDATVWGILGMRTSPESQGHIIKLNWLLDQEHHTAQCSNMPQNVAEIDNAQTTEVLPVVSIPVDSDRLHILQ